MLAVQFDQSIRKLAQNLAGHAAVVDKAGLAPIGAIDAAQDQIILGLDSASDRIARAG